MFGTHSRSIVSLRHCAWGVLFAACSSQSGAFDDINVAAGGNSNRTSGSGGSAQSTEEATSNPSRNATGGALQVPLNTSASTGGATAIPWPPSSDYTNVTEVTYGAYALGPDISDGNVPENTGVTCSGMLFGTVRDFKLGSLSEGHPDFETAPDSTRQGGVSGIVLSQLGDDGKPVYAEPTDPLAGTSGKDNFDQWYRDTPGVNQTYIVAMKLYSADGVSTFSASVNNGRGARDSSYFPLDGAGFGNEERDHNFAFTTEIHTAFVYKGGETFTFVGDDDVWVFVDKQLVIDLGGRHSQLKGSIELDTLGLTQGETYSLDVFNAERHTTQSNFRIDTTLTLANCGQIDSVIL
jgi:fibro-slime domain-containing protein